MASRSNRVLLVVGSGPGIGNATASEFAQRRFNKVALFARNVGRLAQDKATVEEAAKSAGQHIEVRTWAVDIAKLDKFKQSIEEVQQWGELECVFYNAARVIPSAYFDHSIDELRYDFEITTIALYSLVQWIYPQLKQLGAQHPDLSPTIIVTNSALWNGPIPQLFALSLTKAAQHNLVWSLFQHAAPEGVHIAMLSPTGPVSPENKQRNPKNIAARGWDLFAEPRGSWTLETRVEEEGEPARRI